ncbi:hypothetical protein VNI00_004426 [Paramarasmius palmivorus]|uniref:Uncharacterized protein n=1 Tax=Paramarasmius palmivorus TaxID=297713 RepID=A0AAW0DLM7_9AGAR
MKFPFVFAALITTALAQRASIGDPVDGASVTAGQELLIRVDTQPSTSNIDPVGIALGIQSCSSSASGCFAPNSVLGTILYQGPYNPQYSTEAFSLPPHQNFTVAIPADFPKGQAQIGLAGLTIVGASGSPLFGTDNITVTVV